MTPGYVLPWLIVAVLTATILVSLISADILFSLALFFFGLVHNHYALSRLYAAVVQVVVYDVVSVMMTVALVVLHSNLSIRTYIEYPIIPHPILN